MVSHRRHRAALPTHTQPPCPLPAARGKGQPHPPNARESPDPPSPNAHNLLRTVGRRHLGTHAHSIRVPTGVAPRNRASSTHHAVGNQAGKTAARDPVRWNQPCRTGGKRLSHRMPRFRYDAMKEISKNATSSSNARPRKRSSGRDREGPRQSYPSPPHTTPVPHACPLASHHHHGRHHLTTHLRELHYAGPLAIQSQTETVKGGSLEPSLPMPPPLTPSSARTRKRSSCRDREGEGETTTSPPPTTPVPNALPRSPHTTTVAAYGHLQRTPPRAALTLAHSQPNRKNRHGKRE